MEQHLQPAVGEAPEIAVKRSVILGDTRSVLVSVDVRKSYGAVEALRGVDLTVEAGQVVALLGRNGAGKTTLVSIVAGLVRPDGGTVRVDGVDVAARPAAAARRIGIAPQETGIYRVLTVRENLRFFGELAGVSRHDLGPRIAQVAEQLGLAQLLDRRADRLSGGEARRLHTACALLHRPGLLLLDEPTVGADVTARAELIEAVRQLAADGAAVVYTTHYLPEVVSLNADIVIVDRGLVLERGTQADLVARHRVAGLDITLDGDAPLALAGIDALALGPGRWRLQGDITIAELVARLGPRAGALRSTQALEPDLEAVFLAVTGEALDAGDSVTGGSGGDGDDLGGGRHTDASGSRPR